MANNPVNINPLGQISDRVVEQVKESGADAAKAVVSEPAKILEQILSGSVNDLEQANPQANSGQSQQQNDLKLKQQESLEESAASYKLHQQRLQEEINYHSAKKQEEKMVEQQTEKQEEEQKKQIVQLKKENQDDAVWQQQLKAVQGSHEGQQGKM